MLFRDVANIIISLPVINGSDHTPGFYGHDKQTKRNCCKK